MASTESAVTGSVVREAARGVLPDWACAGERRRAHMQRVADLMGSWAADLGLSSEDQTRWRAAGWLHDALRDAPAEDLVDLVPDEVRDWPPPLLHGPAAAERLPSDADPALLDAVRYHTVGHPSLDRIGRALYLADFLEPERKFAAEWRAGLRARMPGDMDAVLVEVVAARIRHLLDTRMPIRRETAAFWSGLVRERA